MEKFDPAKYTYFFKFQMAMKFKKWFIMKINVAHYLLLWIINFRHFEYYIYSINMFIMNIYQMRGIGFKTQKLKYKTSIRNWNIALKFVFVFCKQYKKCMYDDVIWHMMKFFFGASNTYPHCKKVKFKSNETSHDYCLSHSILKIGDFHSMFVCIKNNSSMNCLHCPLFFFFLDLLWRIKVYEQWWAYGSWDAFHFPPRNIQGCRLHLWFRIED